MDGTLFLKNFLKFATFGITVEIFYTAIVDLLTANKAGQKINWDLKGNSYIWMFPIYGSISIFAYFLLPQLAPLNIILRALIYGVVILIVEYITGFLIQKITGKCPWHYEAKWAIHHLIRLDYLPLWMGFGLIVEWYYYF